MLFARLLSANFLDRDSLAQQIAESTVTEIDENGSLEFHSRSNVLARVKMRVPVSAEANDRDDIPISVLLHVVDGRVTELEIYKADGSRIQEMPAIESFKVFVPE